MFEKKSYGLKMDKTIDVFAKELASLRTGRANASMLDLVKVDVYGQQMPINQLASITTPEPRMINIQVWDQNNVALIDASIKKSELGLNPQIDGQLIRLPIPELNEERRTELKKMIKAMGEKCKVSIRNIRREANEELKKLLKSKEISEDEEKINEKNIQTITDDHIKLVDEKVPKRDENDKKIWGTYLKGLNLSDVLIINNWINYAHIIGDFSYKKIFEKKIKPNFLNKILENQIEFRKNNF